MSKYDSRQRGRFSQVGSQPQTLGYVPVVKSAVVDADDWREMKRADVDPSWPENDNQTDDEALPLPDLDGSPSDPDLPLPERLSSDELANGERVSLGDGDLPLPDMGVSLADGDLPLPNLPAFEDEEPDPGRVGIVPPEAPATASALASELAPLPEPTRASGAPAVMLSRAPGAGAGRGASLPAPVPSQPSAAASSSDARLDPPGLAPLDDPFAAELSASPAPLFAEVAPSAPAAHQHAPVPAGALRSSPAGRTEPSSPAPAAMLHSAAAPAGQSSTPAPAVSTPAPAAPTASLPAQVEGEPPRDFLGEMEEPPPLTPVAPAGPTPGIVAPLPRPTPQKPPPPPPARTSSLPSDEMRVSTARAWLEAGRVDEGFALLEQLCAQQPDHEPCRALLLELCFRLPRASKVLAHVEWVQVRLLQTGRNGEACELYRRLRNAFPELALSERVLVLAIEAADRAGDAQIVIDAAKLLVHLCPESGYVGRVLVKVADYQHAAGRADLARGTLEYVVTQYPDDPAAAVARQKLVGT